MSLSRDSCGRPGGSQLAVALPRPAQAHLPVASGFPWLLPLTTQRAGCRDSALSGVELIVQGSPGIPPAAWVVCSGLWTPRSARRLRLQGAGWGLCSSGAMAHALQPVWRWTAPARPPAPRRPLREELSPRGLPRSPRGLRIRPAIPRHQQGLCCWKNVALTLSPGTPLDPPLFPCSVSFWASLPPQPLVFRPI